MPELSVGFIGLGNLGGPMAYMLSRAGRQVFLWARRPESLEPLAGSGAVSVPTLQELGRRVDLVMLMVGDDADVEDVILRRGLLDAMRPGTAIAVHSTVHPDTCRRLAALAAERRVMLVDAPVGRGSALRNRAIQEGYPVAVPGTYPAGKLYMLVGGDQQAFDYCLPVFSSIADATLVGPIGSGQMAKLLMQSLFVANIGLAREAMTLGTELGMDPAVLGGLLREGDSRSYGMDYYLHPRINVAHSAALLRKDVGIAEAIVRDAGLDSAGIMPIAEQALTWMEEAGRNP